MCITFILCAALMATMLPHKQPFMSSLFPHDQYGCFKYLFIFILEAYSKGVVCWTISFTWIYQGLTIIVLGFWLKEISKERLQRVQLTDKIKHFRMMEILNIYFKYSHTTLSFGYSVTAFYSTSIITLFSCIRFHSITSIFEYMLFPLACTFLTVVLTLLLHQSASVYMSSLRVLDCIRKEQFGTKQGRRDFIALKPFGVQVGTVGYVRNSSLIMACGVYSNYTASLLVALPDSFFRH